MLHNEHVGESSLPGFLKLLLFYELSVMWVVVFFLTYKI